MYIIGGHYELSFWFFAKILMTDRYPVTPAVSVTWAWGRIPLVLDLDILLERKVWRYNRHVGQTGWRVGRDRWKNEFRAEVLELNLSTAHFKNQQFFSAPQNL